MGTAYLIEHPPRIRQFKPRGTTPSGVVILHTAENVPDTIGIDSGAEGVAAFIAARTTPGSYHELCDSDSALTIVPWAQQAYGEGTGTNPHAFHISAATQAHRWGSLPKEWRDATVANMARSADEFRRYCETHHGFTIPPRWVTAAEARQRKEGFTTHGAMDPERRTDPGKDFPRGQFLELYVAYGAPDAPPVPTRGERVDRALRKLSAAIREVEAALPADGPRGAKLDTAEATLRLGRRQLRNISILDKKE